MAQIDEALARFDELRQDLEEKFREILRSFSVATEELINASHTDEPTGLGNNRAFEADLELVSENNESFVILCGDIDNFKQVNSEHQHAGGDLAIMAVGEHIKKVCTATGASGYHISGDEFVILGLAAKVNEITAELEASMRAVEVSRSSNTSTNTFTVSLSFGYANILTGTDPKLVQSRADVACEFSKLNPHQVCMQWYEGIDAEIPNSFRWRCNKCSSSIKVETNLNESEAICPMCRESKDS